jgi:phage shock protein PspC (stress-responsive transcriptional regulator)
MEPEADFADEDVSSNNGLQDLWSLDEIDPKRARFPCCIVWTPLPVVSWLAPYIGHVGSVARYLQLDRKKVRMIRNNSTFWTMQFDIDAHLVLYFI